jgi:hypothetical protein
MKLISLVLIASSLVSLPVSALDRDSIIIIKPDSNNKPYNNNAKLWDRIHRLERAVAQLQDQVFHLSTNQIQVAAVNHTTCMINTTFNGSFNATAPTRMAAAAETMEKCMKGTNNSQIDCNEKKMTCGN